MDGDRTLRTIYNLTSTSTVMDLGGFQGDWSSDIYSRYRCKIHIFEPVAQFAAVISKRFATNPDIHLHKIGLGDTTREAEMSVFNDGSSTYRKGNATEQIRIVDIHEWWNQSGIDKVDLMKVNIEGGEYEVIPRLIETGLIRKIKNLQVQFHKLDADSENRMLKLRQGLGQTHQSTYLYDFLWENWELKS